MTKGIRIVLYILGGLLLITLVGMLICSTLSAARSDLSGPDPAATLSLNPAAVDETQCQTLAIAPLVNGTAPG